MNPDDTESVAPRLAAHPYAEIALSQGKVALVDPADWDDVARYKWWAEEVKRGDRIVWYAKREVAMLGKKRRTVKLHRLLVGEPLGMDVDHIDGDGLNCRRYNLRICTRRQNLQNRHNVAAGTTSRLLGVSWETRRGCWTARICAGKINANGEASSLFLGYFDTEEAAARARDVASLRYFGEFASLNFPEDK